MIVQVTQKHIDRGEQFKRNGNAYGHCCPVALAIKDVNNGYDVTVNRTGLYGLLGHTRVELPLAATEFIDKFDTDKPVQPFQFEIPDPKFT